MSGVESGKTPVDRCCDFITPGLKHFYLSSQLHLISYPASQSLLAVWMDEPFRATRDIDLLAFGKNDREAVRKAVETICSVPCTEDGLRFDSESIRVAPVRDTQFYGGQRARVRAFLGETRATVQVDFGFGDATAPERHKCPLCSAACRDGRFQRSHLSQSLPRSLRPWSSSVSETAG